MPPFRGQMQRRRTVVLRLLRVAVDVRAVVEEERYKVCVSVFGGDVDGRALDVGAFSGPVGGGAEVGWVCAGGEELGEEGGAAELGGPEEERILAGEH